MTTPAERRQPERDVPRRDPLLDLLARMIRTAHDRERADRRANILSRLERELDALAREDAALVEQARAIVAQRTDVARRIEEVRTAGAVVRRVLAGAAS